MIYGSSVVLEEMMKYFLNFSMKMMLSVQSWNGSEEWPYFSFINEENNISRELRDQSES